MESTTGDLSEFLSTFSPDEDGHRMMRGDFFYDIAPGFRDFNREIVPCGDPELPGGAVGIRADTDFWQMALLPARFANLDCRQIVSTIWPDLKKVLILPDSGDYWWQARSDEGLEVPGEPWELWALYEYANMQPGTERIETFADLDSAVKKADDLRSSPPIRWQIRRWHDGSRSAVREGQSRQYQR